MRHIIAALATALVVCVAMVSPPLGSAAADGTPPPPPPPPAPSPSPTPAPTPAPSAPSNCAACAQCVAGCGPTYLACTGKCVGQPDMQGCIAKCPTVPQCIQACPCSGCSIPGMPH